jgi:hypothetical protein
MKTLVTIYKKRDYNTILRAGAKFFGLGSIVLFAVYLYCVGAVTFSVVHRRNMEEDLKALSSDISRGELTYLTAEKTLTRTYALAQGFVAPAQVTYTAPKTDLAINTPRR